MSKKKNVIARFGNFEVTKDSGPEHDYLRIRTIKGHWSLTHRDDSTMYGIWMAMLKSPEYLKVIETRIMMEYSMSQIIYDEGFLRDWWKAFGEYDKRMAANAPTHTEQEEAEAVAEVEMMGEVKKNHT